MKDLVEIIKNNPGATFIIDNDCWHMEDQIGMVIVCDHEVMPRGDGGYGSGNIYGGDILHALAEIVGVNIRSV